MKNRLPLLLSCVSLLILATACSKDPGAGGTSSIFGKIYVKDYNTTFTVLQEEYYAPKEDVFIIYGDDKTYSDHVNTNYDGTFEFNYLRKGTYHIYAYSKDSTLQTNALIPVVKDIEITKNNSESDAGEILIFK
jgi:hypothetical protein